MEQKIRKFIERMKIENPGIVAIALGNQEEVLFEHHFVQVHSRNI